MSSSTVPVAIVTGASSGIGRATAVALADAGHSVVVADIAEDAGRSLVDELNLNGGRHLYVRADMTSQPDIERLVARTDEEFGALDLLVNNAAITRTMDLFDVTPADWDAIFAVNARGTFFTMQAAAPLLARDGGGSIVNVASIAGKGWRETSNIAYAASKGAVVTMTRIAAARLGKLGIRVNSICPGMTKTEMMLGWLQTRADADGVAVSSLLEDLSTQVPLGRLNEPSDIAAAVLFLGSDAARTITGQSMNIDGGIVFD